MITNLIWLAVPLVAGFALPRRYRDWPAAIVIGTVCALVTGIATTVYLVPVIGGFLAGPDEFVAVHQHDRWAQVYPDGPPEPSQVGPILIGIAIGLVVAVTAWFAVVGVAWAGMGLRQLIGLARPSQRPVSSGGSSAANSAG